MTEQGTVLDRILSKKRVEVEQLKADPDAGDLRRKAYDSPPARNFFAALRDCPRTPIIAEIKKASPSAGTLKSDVDVARWSRNYQQAGAAALSVLTDGPFFGGCLDDLLEARRAVEVPVLRKDFIIDPLQLYQSRAAGADAVLLITAALESFQLKALFSETLELGMTPLVEVHNEKELVAAMTLNPTLVGINNRDLKTLQVSLETCLKLRPLINNGALVVAESGIQGPGDINKLSHGGLDAFLVGTILTRVPDPAAMLASLCRAGA